MEVIYFNTLYYSFLWNDLIDLERIMGYCNWKAFSDIIALFCFDMNKLCLLNSITAKNKFRFDTIFYLYLCGTSGAEVMLIINRKINGSDIENVNFNVTIPLIRSFSPMSRSTVLAKHMGFLYLYK